MSAAVEPSTTAVAGRTAPRAALLALLILFTLSGAAGLIYETVWFQLLRLTIGGNAQSLGVLLACFMGGLFLGSVLYARVIPRSWHPLRTYAVFEFIIAACGLILPYVVDAVRELYFSHATSPQMALLLRSLICTLLLGPPTVLMGATLPALARWIRADQVQSRAIGGLYTANIFGAVAGVFGAALVLLPQLGLIGTNLVAVGLNVLVALLALAIRTPRPEPAVAPDHPQAARPAVPASLQRERRLIMIAYGASGMAALSYEVLWARLMGSVFGTTVYAFALVLGMFLLGLALGGAVGSAIAPRLTAPRRAFGRLQLAVVACAGLTSMLVSEVPLWFAYTDRWNPDNMLILTLTNLVRSAAVVLPGAFFWGMCFPVAVRALRIEHDDAGWVIGRLYGWNTLGAVLGSLATSFLLIPRFGTAAGAAQLVLLPLAAGLAACWPARLPAITALIPVILAAVLGYGTDWPRQANTLGRAWAMGLDSPTTYLLVAFLPAFLGFELFLVKRVPQRLAWGACVTGLLVAFTTSVPAELYKLGRRYAEARLTGESDGEIVLFEEGAMEPVVVYHSAAGPLEVSINSFLCASTTLDGLEHLRLLGHLPALLSRDPSQSIVVGLGAGVTSGCLGIHDRVERVQVIELEPKVKLAAALFAEPNHDVMNNPKVDIRIDDGRHFIATTDQKFGVITSDPIEPFWAGSAALYTVEHYRRCRERLIEGGVFCQWLGVYGLDEEGTRSLLAAFAEAFPEGSIWVTPTEMILIGSTGPMVIDIPELRRRMEEPDVRESLAFVGIRSAEELCGRLLCTIASLKDYLAGAEPNRDRTLTIQYTGWKAYYQALRWNREIRTLLDRHRAYAPELFRLPAGEETEFRAAVEREWPEFLRPEVPMQPATPDDENSEPKTETGDDS